MPERQPIAFAGPLYEQVHRVIRSRILAGEWEPREPLPGEAHLSQELGVSVGTVRKAMDQLTRENIVVRERGRGTFVKGDSEWRANSAFRLCGHDGRSITPRIKLVDTRVSAATTSEAAALKLRGLNGTAPHVLRLYREWTADDVLLCREAILVEKYRFPGLDHDMDGSAETLFATYAETYRLKVDRAHWAIGPSPQRAISTFGHEPMPDEPGLFISRTAMDAQDAPIEVCEQTVLLNNCLVQISR